MTRWALVLCFLVALSTPGHAETPLQACDRLASARVDRDNAPGTVPVTLEDLDAPAAVTACRAAVAVDPRSGRSLFHLARALDKEGSSEAVAMYEKAGAAGSTRALFDLAAYYAFGQRHLPQDREKARRLLETVAEAGDLSLAATTIVGPKGEIFLPLSPDWYEKAAVAGHPSALVNLAEVLDQDRDYSKAYDLFRKAAATGDADALYTLGAFIARGNGVAKNADETVRLLKTAVAKGQLMAMVALGQMYRDGDGVPRDLDRARALFTRAAASGYAPAKMALGALPDQ